MDCGADTIEIQEPDGTMRGIEIIPEGCQAVSEDVCKSGYMAPTENISFPEDSLKQCCKCKEGESCQFCKNPDACTEEEKDEFVTSENCFGAISTKTKTKTEEETKTKTKTEEELNINYYIVIGVIILFILSTILFTRRSKSF